MWSLFVTTFVRCCALSFFIDMMFDYKSLRYPLKFVNDSMLMIPCRKSTFFFNIRKCFMLFAQNSFSLAFAIALSPAPSA